MLIERARSRPRRNTRGPVFRRCASGGRRSSTSIAANPITRSRGKPLSRTSESTFIRRQSRTVELDQRAQHRRGIQVVGIEHEERIAAGVGAARSAPRGRCRRRSVARRSRSPVASDVRRRRSSRESPRDRARRRSRRSCIPHRPARSARNRGTAASGRCPSEVEGRRSASCLWRRPRRRRPVPAVERSASPSCFMRLPSPRARRTAFISESMLQCPRPRRRTMKRLLFAIDDRRRAAGRFDAARRAPQPQQPAPPPPAQTPTADPYANNPDAGKTQFPLAAPAGKDSGAKQAAPGRRHQPGRVRSRAHGSTAPRSTRRPDRRSGIP